MEKFLNKKIYIKTTLGGGSGAGTFYRGVMTSFDDEYVCLDNKIYIVRKFILSIQVL